MFSQIYDGGTNDYQCLSMTFMHVLFMHWLFTHLPFMHFRKNKYQIKSNQMSLPNVRFAVKTTSVTPPSITGRYQCTTQADRDVGYRE